MRLSHPYTGPNTFPATCPDEYLQALHGQGFAERVQGEFDCSEQTLQELASANPVAGALAFDALIENVRTNLQPFSTRCTTTHGCAYQGSR